MMAPALAVEAPTPLHENAFQFGDISPSDYGNQKSLNRFESPLKASFNFHNTGGIFHSSATDTFSSSPNTSPASFHLSSFSSRSFYGDQPSDVYSKAVGVPIARTNVKGNTDTPFSARKVSRHHRDLSGTSSTTSSLSGPPYDFCPAIDPSALQPPLRKLQNETSFTNNETNHIISPFINQVLEHGPNGTMIGRYSRPLTSTGRPSHARKTPPGHVKRPRNAFILFRSHACSSNLIPPTVEKDHRQISRIVSHMWKSLPAAEKVKWEREAEAEKELHRKLHPDYRYKPIYRKENSGKKNQGGLNSSSPAKKKSTLQKKMNKGINFDNTKSLPKETEKCVPVNQKSPDQLQHERDEEIRCEAVAKVLMETKLTGITLDEGEVEERVLEQVRLAKENDANQSRMKTQSQTDCQSDPALVPNTDASVMSISGRDKPKNKLLAPLQARRKSLHNRSNSAPPPPSPLRKMHVREAVYNPKARGSRELSPDFPKPKLMNAEDEMKIDNINYQPEDISHGIMFPGNFSSQLAGEQAFNPFAALSTKNNPSYHHYESESTPSQELEQLFHSPDFAFADQNCFRSQQNDISNGLFTSHMSDPDDYPIFNGIYTETKSRYCKDAPDQRNWESFFYQNNGHYSSEFCDPLTKLPEDATKSVHFLGNSNVPERPSDKCNSCEEKKSTQQSTMENDFLKNLVNVPNVRRPSLNVFTPSSMRRKSSVTMALTESCNPQLIEAIELAKKNMAVFTDQKEKWCSSPNESNKRRHSVVLSGLGEFPIMDLPVELSEYNSKKTISDVRMECDENRNHPALAPELSQSNFSNTNSHGCARDSSSSFSTEYGNMGCGHVDTKEPPPPPPPTQVLDESNSSSSLPGITFESGIGQDGQTYLFLTKEQAETEGLIAQILDAGFGVTYETDIPQEEEL